MVLPKRQSPNPQKSLCQWCPFSGESLFPQTRSEAKRGRRHTFLVRQIPQSHALHCPRKCRDNAACRMPQPSGVRVAPTTPRYSSTPRAHGLPRAAVPPPPHPVLLQTAPMALRLSADEWLLISDFAQSQALSHACTTTRGILRWRHMARGADFGSDANPGPTDDRSEGVWKRSKWLASLATLKSARRHRVAPLPSPQPLHIDGLQLLSRLSSEAALHTLTLRCSNMKPGSAQALAALKHAPSLWSLTLILPDNNIGDSGAQALAELKEAPALTTLTLDLEGNSIGDAGAQALATLKDAASLSALDLNLRRNRIRASGAEALAQLPSAPSLNSLILVHDSTARRPVRSHRPGRVQSHPPSPVPSPSLAPHTGPGFFPGVPHCPSPRTVLVH